MKADKINMIINFSILALLIYLAVAVKSLQKQVSWAPTIIKPMGMNSEMSHDIQTLQCIERSNQPNRRTITWQT